MHLALLVSRRSILPTGNLASLCCSTARRSRRDDQAHPMPERHRKVTTDRTFADLGVRVPLISVLAAHGITQPFPIQVATLPDTLAGRDVLGRGKTGSGKTLAFSIPLVSRLSGNNRHPSRPSGLVLAPTRDWRPRSPRRWNRWQPSATCASPQSSAAYPKPGRCPHCDQASTSWWPAQVGLRT